MSLQKSFISAAVGGVCGVPIANANCEKLSIPLALRLSFNPVNNSSHLFWKTVFDSVYDEAMAQGGRQLTRISLLHGRISTPTEIVSVGLDM